MVMKLVKSEIKAGGKTEGNGEETERISVPLYIRLCPLRIPINFPLTSFLLQSHHIPYLYYPTSFETPQFPLFCEIPQKFPEKFN